MTTALVTVSDPDSLDAETYRVLRTNLLAAMPADAKVLLVTSPAPNEGAALTAANLAVVVAQGGRGVVLVDADFRTPTMHVLFGLANDDGLAQALAAGNGAGDGTAARLRPSGVDNLRVLTTGPAPERPADAVSAPAMGQAVAAAGAAADMVLVTAPPLLASSDGAALARWCDGVVLCLMAGHSRRSEAAQARTVLDRVHAPVVGVVLTGVAPGESGLAYHADGAAP